MHGCQSGRSSTDPVCDWGACLLAILRVCAIRLDHFLADAAHNPAAESRHNPSNSLHRRLRNLRFLCLGIPSLSGFQRIHGHSHPTKPISFHPQTQPYSSLYHSIRQFGFCHADTTGVLQLQGTDQHRC